MSLAKYSLDNTKIIYFFLAVLLIGGITYFGKLGKKEDAPFVIKSAVIMTRNPGAEPAGPRRELKAFWLKLLFRRHTCRFSVRL